jgi:hypothetical protein
MEQRSNGVLEYWVSQSAKHPSHHYSVTPTLHHSNTPSLHHSNTPLLRAITTSALYGNAFVLDMGPNNLVEIRFGFEPEPTRARCI